MRRAVVALIVTGVVAFTSSPAAACSIASPLGAVSGSFFAYESIAAGVRVAVAA